MGPAATGRERVSRCPVACRTPQNYHHSSVVSAAVATAVVQEQYNEELCTYICLYLAVHASERNNIYIIPGTRHVSTAVDQYEVKFNARQELPGPESTTASKSKPPGDSKKRGWRDWPHLSFCSLYIYAYTQAVGTL